MSTQSIPVFGGAHLSERDSAWVYQLVGECQLIADLAFADIVVWAPTASGRFVAVSHLRPSSAATLFYRDVVGTAIRPEWLTLVSEALTAGAIVDPKVPDSYDTSPTKVRAVPIRKALRSDGSKSEQPVIAVLTRHTNLSDSRVPSRQELTFNECADDLFVMISEGSFPDPNSPSAPRGPLTGSFASMSAAGSPSQAPTRSPLFARWASSASWRTLCWQKSAQKCSRAR